MPQVNIIEKDLTTNNNEQFNVDYTVLVPGPAKEGFEEAEFSNVSEFEDAVGTENEEQLSYKIARKLIGAGLKVLYVKVTNAAALTEDFYTKYADKGNYDLRFITCGGYEPSDAIEQAKAKCATLRGDAVALVDPTGNNVADIDAYVQALTPVIVKRSTGDTESSDVYSAAFAPKVIIGNEAGVEYPAWVVYLMNFAYYRSRFASWYAFAGPIRGVPTVSISPKFKIGDSDNDLLQAREVNEDQTITAEHKACNTISNIRPYGNIVWGNRTLKNISEGLVATSFLNIRQLCCTLKKVIYKACKRFTFEPNSDVLWYNFKNVIVETLDEMKSDNGIKGYNIIKSKDARRGELKAVIQIIPIEAVEDFTIKVELKDNLTTIEVNG